MAQINIYESKLLNLFNMMKCGSYIHTSATSENLCLLGVTFVLTSV